MQQAANSVAIVTGFPGGERPPRNLTILRLNQVKAITGLSRSTIYARIEAGTFPRQVKLGIGARCVGWVAEELNDWVIEQIATRGPDHVSKHDGGNK